mmetsp:Transcript_9445/g.20142  ORF Transcript_9445/g.20142 Transcript_9445/m.20142 type:complete len:93 (-) Transcript_9445:636-914(-)
MYYPFKRLISFTVESRVQHSFWFVHFNFVLSMLLSSSNEDDHQTFATRMILSDKRLKWISANSSTSWLFLDPYFFVSPLSSASSSLESSGIS